MKEPLFDVGDVVTNKSGWKRKIICIVPNYLGDYGRYGYSYMSENYPEKEFVYHGMCSQEHLLNWKRN